jgi:ATP-dependent Clp protease ATP-binding subunit ClpA
MMTDRAAQALKCAAQACDKQHWDHLSLDHIWLGLLQTSKGVGLASLGNCGVDLSELNAEVIRSLPTREPQLSRPIPPRWSAAGLHVVAEALRQSEGINDRCVTGYLGTEHLVWALLETDSAGSRFVRDKGVSPEHYKNELLAILKSPS